MNQHRPQARRFERVKMSKNDWWAQAIGESIGELVGLVARRAAEMGDDEEFAVWKAQTTTAITDAVDAACDLAKLMKRDKQTPAAERPC